MQDPTRTAATRPRRNGRPSPPDPAPRTAPPGAWETLARVETAAAVGRYRTTRHQFACFERLYTEVEASLDAEEGRQWGKWLTVSRWAAEEAETALARLLQARRQDPESMRQLMEPGFDWKPAGAIVDGRLYLVVPSEDRDTAGVIVADLADVDGMAELG